MDEAAAAHDRAGRCPALRRNPSRVPPRRTATCHAGGHYLRPGLSLCHSGNSPRAIGSARSAAHPRRHRGCLCRAAEYGRQAGRPEAFLTLKHYADALPEILLTLFQPSPALAPAANWLKSFALSHRPSGSLAAGSSRHGSGRCCWQRSALFSAQCWPPFFWPRAGPMAGEWRSPRCWAGWPACCSFRSAGLPGPCSCRSTTPPRPLPSAQFGFCTGKTQPGNAHPALTDWIHRALQHIAFGDPEHPTPLTFGTCGLPEQRRFGCRW